METILLRIRPDVDGATVLAAILDDVATYDAIHDGLVDPILDAIRDVDASHDDNGYPIHDVAIHDVLVMAAILQLLLLLHILPLPILANSHPRDVDAFDVRQASNSDVHLLLRCR